MTNLEFKENARIIWLALFGSKATWRPALPVLLAVPGLVLIIISLPPQLAKTIIKENGPVESATVVAYVFLTVALWIRALRVGSRAPLMMSFLTLLVACRELDFNSRFTSRNIEHGFTLAYFFDFKVPGKEKLVVACVLIVLFLSSILSLVICCRRLSGLWNPNGLKLS